MCAHFLSNVTFYSVFLYVQEKTIVLFQSSFFSKANTTMATGVMLCRLLQYFSCCVEVKEREGEGRKMQF